MRIAWNVVKLIRSEVVADTSSLRNHYVIGSGCPASRINLILSLKTDAKDGPNPEIFHKHDAYYEKLHSEKYTLINGYIA